MVVTTNAMLGQHLKPTMSYGPSSLSARHSIRPNKSSLLLNTQKESPHDTKRFPPPVSSFFKTREKRADITLPFWLTILSVFATTWFYCQVNRTLLIWKVIFRWTINGLWKTKGLGSLTVDRKIELTPDRHLKLTPWSGTISFQKGEE